MTQACCDLELWRFVNLDSFLILDLCGWTKADLDIFAQPVDSWQNSTKFQDLCLMVQNLSLLNDNVER